MSRQIKDELITSLPLRQKSIVVGFYMFSAGIIFITALATSIFPAVRSITEKDIIYFSSTFIINTIFCMLLFSILFPFLFKFGYSKMNIMISIIIYGLLPLSLVLYYIKILYTRVYLIDEVEIIINILTGNFAGAIIACLVLYLISMLISIKLHS